MQHLFVWLQTKNNYEKEKGKKTINRERFQEAVLTKTAPTFCFVFYKQKRMPQYRILLIEGFFIINDFRKYKAPVVSLKMKKHVIISTTMRDDQLISKHLCF